jgi:hypothetical protein
MGMRIWLSIVLLALAPGSQAADKQNRFAIEGVGLLTCADYSAARQARSPLYHQFGGWMNGYLTGVNRYVPSTFDMVPWQSTAMLTHWLAEFCEKNPEVQFIRAVTALANRLSDRRMPAYSEMLTLSAGGHQVRIYDRVLRRVQRRLIELGYPGVEENGLFEQPMRDALIKYQGEQGLPETALPDPATLAKLLQ